MICKKCGSFISDNVQFCPSCGAKQNEANKLAVYDVPPTSVEVVKPRKKFTIPQIGMTATALFSGISGVFLSNPGINHWWGGRTIAGSLNALNRGDGMLFILVLVALLAGSVITSKIGRGILGMVCSVLSFGWAVHLWRLCGVGLLDGRGFFFCMLGGLLLVLCSIWNYQNRKRYLF